MFAPHEYTSTVKKVLLDGDTLFEATVTELPEVAEYGDTFEEVYTLAIDTIQTAMEIFAQQGRRFPPPLPRLSEEEYHGHISLRLPKFLRRDRAAPALTSSLVVSPSG
jgi:predicted RNase H-like HicB family nuclease